MTRMFPSMKTEYEDAYSGSVGDWFEEGGE